MIANVIAWSARNLVLIFVGAALSIAGGVYALRTLPLDAIPDLSDVQVIVFTDYPGQAPQVVEDQVTYPLTTSMLTVPKSKVVRGFSFFGVSFVYVIFEDGTDPYWARSRVLEYLNAAASRLPDGVSPSLGPDATGVGWVYQYAIVAKELSLAELRSLQDWVVRFAVSKSEGVAEVASVGGFVKQYSIVVDPARLKAQNVSLSDIADAVRSSNRDVGGRTIELSEFEFMVRGKGYLQGIKDIGNIVLKSNAGVPLRLSDVARVELVPDERRGITELNGEGEVASGIVLQRDGANALTVIENAKESLAAVQSTLPAGTEILPVYDRSKLIEAAIETLKATLIEESIVVALVTVAFLLHVRSALVAIIMLPIGILIAFMAMAGARPRLEYHEPRRDRHRYRRDDRRSHRDDRERPQASRARAAGQAADGSADRSGKRGRSGAVLQPADHHRVVPADLHAGISGGSPVRAARLHQDLRDGGGRTVVDYPGAGIDDLVRPGPHSSGTQEPAQSPVDLDVPSGHRGRPEGQKPDDPRSRRDPRRDRLAGSAYW